MEKIKNIKDTEIEVLGECKIKSPLDPKKANFISPSERVIIYGRKEEFDYHLKTLNAIPMFEKAGSQKKIYFDPKNTICGIVTCGGLCPGLNDVIQAVSITALKHYKVKKVLGFMYGFKGLSSSSKYEPVELTEESVKDISNASGTILGTSRGPQDEDDMIDTLLKYEVNILFVIGGDGTLKGGMALSKRIRERKLKISIVGVPKTIDNDICWTSRSFGFLTAVGDARTAVYSAHTEARAAYNGIGIVKIMGRESGFIATHVTLASGCVNFCLIPEVDFDIDGKNGLLEQLKKRLLNKQHAVIVVAEGAGQKFFDKEKIGKDLSGNQKMGDIGLFLKEKIKEYLTKENIEHTVKYIDPSYIIRNQLANSADSEFCLVLGQNAVHAAMTGKTNMAVGIINEHFVNIPFKMMVGKKKQVKADGDLWKSVIAVTGQ
ncbi:MAG: ATP-dependent 6-phosphofructokinase [Bdellovibrionota bacterium]